MRKWFLDLLRNGRQPIGTLAMLPSIDVCEILGLAGFEFVIIDFEHSPTTQETMVNMIRALEAVDVPSIVRVSGIIEPEIKRALSAGASTVFVPNVNSVEDARRVAEYAHYPPLGSMGTCPFDRVYDYGVEGLGVFGKEDVFQEMNNRRGVMIAVESLEGMRQFKEIIKVPGIDIVDVGMCDLATDMGHHGDLTHPEVVEITKEAIKIAHMAGKYIVLGTPDHDSMQFWMAEGCDAVIYSTDCGILAREGARMHQELARYRCFDNIYRDYKED